MEEIRIIVSQFGARMHYAVPVTFERAGMLHRLYTDFYASPRMRRILSIANHYLRLMFLRRAAERYHPEVPLNKIKMQPLLGIFYNFGRLVFRKNAERHHRMTVKIVEKFHHKISPNDLKKANVLYTYVGEGLPLAVSPLTNKHFIVSEMYIAMQSWELLIEEMEIWPEWCDVSKIKHLKKIAAIDETRTIKQLEASDLIICPSEFVANGVKRDYLHKKVKVIPYGYDFSFEHHINSNGFSRDPHKIKIIFVGSIDLRKGLPYLWQAAKMLQPSSYPQVEFHLVGSLDHLPPQIITKLDQVFYLHGHLPRFRVGSLLANSDIFVLPSIAEGSATVVYEALAAGLPVITTPNSGSVVRNGIEGFLVPIRDHQALAERISQLVADPELRRKMSRNARVRAGEFTVTAYGNRLIRAIKTGWYEKHG